MPPGMSISVFERLFTRLQAHYRNGQFDAAIQIVVPICGLNPATSNNLFPGEEIDGRSGGRLLFTRDALDNQFFSRKNWREDGTDMLALRLVASSQMAPV